MIKLQNVNVVIAVPMKPQMPDVLRDMLDRRLRTFIKTTATYYTDNVKFTVLIDDFTLGTVVNPAGHVNRARYIATIRNALINKIAALGLGGGRRTRCGMVRCG